MCLRLSVVTKLYRCCGHWFIIIAAGSEILMWFKYPHVLLKVAEFFSSRINSLV